MLLNVWRNWEQWELVSTSIEKFNKKRKVKIVAKFEVGKGESRQFIGLVDEIKKVLRSPLSQDLIYLIREAKLNNNYDFQNEGYLKNIVFENVKDFLTIRYI